MSHSFRKMVTINAPASFVWDSLTRAELMKAWMGEPDMQIEIETDWAVGRPIVVRGFHHRFFENAGKVLAFHPMKRLTYTHLSSLSQLPDGPENYSTLEFGLDSAEEATSVTLVVSGFPTESIFKHLQFYWSGTLEVLKQDVKRRLSQSAEHSLGDRSGA